MASRVPELIDALVSRWRAAEGLAGVEVTDGPQVTDSAALDWVLVGFDGDAGGDYIAASASQDWSGMSTRRGERIALTVGVVAARGDTDVKAARDRVYALARVLEDDLRANPAVGLVSAQVAVESSVLRQEQTQAGVQARLLLTLGCDGFS